MIEKMGFSAYFLIVWDFVKFAKDSGIAVGPGPRLGGRLARLLLPEHHRGRPARLRPAVRALPQPRARVDAGHRHRLLGQGPRAGDALRGGQVRQGVRRADRHLRQDAAAQRHARRRARARARLRRRRPAGEADPRAGDGPLEVLRRVPRPRSPSCAAPTTPSPRRARSSTRPGGSRASSATPGSTRPRS